MNWLCWCDDDWQTLALMLERQSKRSNLWRPRKLTSCLMRAAASQPSASLLHRSRSIHCSPIFQFFKGRWKQIFRSNLLILNFSLTSLKLVESRKTHPLKSLVNNLQYEIKRTPHILGISKCISMWKNLVSHVMQSKSLISFYSLQN